MAIAKTACLIHLISILREQPAAPRTSIAAKQETWGITHLRSAFLQPVTRRVNHKIGTWSKIYRFNKLVFRGGFLTGNRLF